MVVASLSLVCLVTFSITNVLKPEGFYYGLCRCACDRSDFDVMVS